MIKKEENLGVICPGRNRMTESRDPEFEKILKEYAAFKESKTGNSEITMQEGHELRDYYEESKNPAFQEALKDFSAFKEERTGNSEVTLAEKIVIYNQLLHKNILNI